MTFVVDESIDREIVEQLRKRGYEVAYIAELEPSLGDDAVLSLALSKGAVLLTADKDFGELVYRKGQLSSGVMLLRLPRQTPHQRALLTEQIIEDHQDVLPRSFCVITDKKVRFRKL